MLLAPFTLTETPVRPLASRRHEIRSVPLWLKAWAIVGIFASVLFPFLRGGEMTGMSLPFWLIAAPLINIAWLGRSQGLARVRHLGTRVFARKNKSRRRI